MVTVITHEDAEYVNPNPFPGMSLAEACAQLELETVQQINEFQMSLLLSEHAYLYENGVEMDYVDEAGSLNEKGKQVLQKIRDTIDGIARSASELWDKLIEWVLERCAEIGEFFKKAGITKSVASKAAAKFDEVYPEGVKMSSSTVVEYDNFLKKYKEMYNTPDDDSNKDVNIYSTYVKKGDATESVVSKADFEKAAGIVFGPKTVIADIKRCKNDANKVLNDLKSELKYSKGEDINETINKLKKAAQNNSKICRESIRVYHAYVSQQISIVRAVVMGAPMRKAIGDAAKAAVTDAVKSVPGEAKELGKKGAAAVSGAAKTAGKAVENAGKTAGKAVAGVAKKGADEVKDLGGKAAEGVKSAGKAVGDASKKIFNGKHFKTK